MKDQSLAGRVDKIMAEQSEKANASTTILLRPSMKARLEAIVAEEGYRSLSSLGVAVFEAYLRSRDERSGGAS